MEIRTLDQILADPRPIEDKSYGSLRERSMFTRKNREQSKKRRLMAKRSRRINRRK